MQLEESDISCGIAELSSIKKASKREISQSIDEARDNDFAVVLASLTKKQKGAQRRLLALGFYQASSWRRNPNSGNKIALFVKVL